MFKSLQDFLQKQLSGNESEPDPSKVRLAAATLMFELIRSDGQIDDVELHKMADILESQFDLARQDIDTLVEVARESAEEAISLHSFTREICDNWNTEQREQLIENLWVLAFADSIIDAHERHLLRKVAGLLYLNDAQIIKTRVRAKRSLNIN